MIHSQIALLPARISAKPSGENFGRTMAYYSSLGPNNYCCYNESEVERTKTVEIQAPVDYVWSILTNVHDYSTWSDFTVTGVISQGAFITLKDNSTMVQSDDGRLHRVKAVKGRVSKLIDKKTIEFSFDRGEVGWSVGLAFYLQEASPSLTKVENIARYFGPYGEQVEKVLNERMGHLKLFCEHSQSTHNSFDIRDRTFPVAVGVAPLVSNAEAIREVPAVESIREATEPQVKDAKKEATKSSPGAAETRGDKPITLTDELVKIADLKKQGLLSDDEYSAAKRRLLFDSNGYTRLYG